MTGKHRKVDDPEQAKTTKMSKRELEKKLQRIKDQIDFPPMKGTLK